MVEATIVHAGQPFLALYDKTSRVISFVEGGASGRDMSDGNEATRVSQVISEVEETSLGCNVLNDDIPGRGSSVDDAQVDRSGGVPASFEPVQAQVQNICTDCGPDRDFSTDRMQSDAAVVLVPYA